MLIPPKQIGEGQRRRQGRRVKQGHEEHDPQQPFRLCHVPPVVILRWFYAQITSPSLGRCHILTFVRVLVSLVITAATDRSQTVIPLVDPRCTPSLPCPTASPSLNLLIPLCVPNLQARLFLSLAVPATVTASCRPLPRVYSERRTGAGGPPTLHPRSLGPRCFISRIAAAAAIPPALPLSPHVLSVSFCHTRLAPRALDFSRISGE